MCFSWVVFLSWKGLYTAGYAQDGKHPSSCSSSQLGACFVLSAFFLWLACCGDGLWWSVCKHQPGKARPRAQNLGRHPGCGWADANPATFTVNKAIEALLRDKYHAADDIEWLESRKGFIRWAHCTSKEVSESLELSRPRASSVAEQRMLIPLGSWMGAGSVRFKHCLLS